MVEYIITDLTLEDFDEVTDLWRNTEGIGLSSADTRERIGIYLERNPGLSFTARASGKLIGAVLCGHDGRRGYLHHLAVRAEWRKKGVARVLIERCMAGLGSVGIEKCHIFVYAHNKTGKAFWQHEGWMEREDLLFMSRDV